MPLDEDGNEYTHTDANGNPVTAYAPGTNPDASGSKSKDDDSGKRGWGNRVADANKASRKKYKTR